MTDSLKNMLTSVDWKRLMSSSDAKNALVGSALGGLMLGGASLASDRDPEESKYTPVGDALIGALLGGAAGYGIPKGLSLFSNAGSMAPSNDQIPDHWASVMGQGAAKGGIIGSSVIGISTIPTYLRALKKRLGDAEQLRSHAQPMYDRIAKKLQANLNSQDAARKAKAIEAQLKSLAYGNSGVVDGTTIGSYRQAIDYLNSRIKASGTANVDELKRELKQLRRYRFKRNWGVPKSPWGAHKAILRTVEREAISGEPTKKVLGMRLLGKLDNYISDFTNGGKHYAKKPVGPIKFRAGSRMALRAGKYGAAAAVLGALLSGFFGASAEDNFKN